MIAETVYVLCLLTSLFCAVLLFRSYRASRSRLLLWSTLGFLGLALNNALLVMDLLMFPDVDLRILRTSVGFAAGLIMLGGLIWEQR